MTCGNAKDLLKRLRKSMKSPSGGFCENIRHKCGNWRLGSFTSQCARNKWKQTNWVVCEDDFCILSLRRSLLFEWSCLYIILAHQKIV